MNGLQSIGQSDAMRMKDAPAAGVRPAAGCADRVPHLVRWLCEELVNALLRPVYARWRDAVRAGAPWSDVYELRFLCLVDAAPCWPCLIEWGGDIAGLSITVGFERTDEIY